MAARRERCVDPTRLVGFGLTADDDVTKAISAQNAQVASGSIGAQPSKPDQQISALVLVKGQFATPEEFGAIVLRANPDGSTVRLRDVARVEVGGLSYQFTTRRNGEPVAGLSVLLAPKSNALATATAVNFTASLFATLAAALILQEDVRFRRWSAVVLGFVGVLVTMRPGASSPIWASSASKARTKRGWSGGACRTWLLKSQ